MLLQLYTVLWSWRFSVLLSFFGYLICLFVLNSVFCVLVSYHARKHHHFLMLELICFMRIIVCCLWVSEVLQCLNVIIKNVLFPVLAIYESLRLFHDGCSLSRLQQEKDKREDDDSGEDEEFEGGLVVPGKIWKKLYK